MEYLTFDVPGGIPLDAFRTRSHHIAMGLYEGRTAKIMQRDLRVLEELRLVCTDAGLLRANLALLNE